VSPHDPNRQLAIISISHRRILSAAKRNIHAPLNY